MFYHNIITINDIKRWFLLIKSKISNALVQIIRMPVTSVPNKTHSVFKTACHSSRIMIFQDRYINKNISLKQKLMYFGFLKFYSTRYFNLLVIAFRVSRNHFRTD